MLFSRNRELQYETKKRQEVSKDFKEECQKVNGYLKERVEKQIQNRKPLH